MRKAALLFQVLIGLVGKGVPATISNKSPELLVESYESYCLFTELADELPPNIVNRDLILDKRVLNTISLVPETPLANVLQILLNDCDFM